MSLEELRKIAIGDFDADSNYDETKMQLNVFTIMYAKECLTRQVKLLEKMQWLEELNDKYLQSYMEDEDVSDSRKVDYAMKNIAMVNQCAKDTYEIVSKIAQNEELMEMIKLERSTVNALQVNAINIDEPKKREELITNVTNVLGLLNDVDVAELERLGVGNDNSSE